jgi:hypothetical protein
MILILFILILALDAYLFFALKNVLFLLEVTSGPTILILSVFATLSILAMGYILHGYVKRPVHFRKQSKDRLFASIIGSYMAKVFTSLILLIDDLRRGIYWLIQILGLREFTMDRTLLVSGGGLMIGLILYCLLIYGMIRNPHRYKVRRVNIPIKNVPKALEGLRIVQISDIHSGSFTKGLPVKKGIQMINALEPDFIFFTGDLVNHVADEIDPYIDIFRQLKSRYGVYSILGNHDYGDYVTWSDIEDKRENLNQLYAKHEEMGWELLLNEFRKIKVGEAEIGIIGVENYSAHPRFAKYGDMQKATNGFEQSDINILLSHDPTHWDDEIISVYPFVDLTLSGHTHGFQFGFEFSRKLRWSPIQYVYRKWAGLYRAGKQYLYINRGFGYLGYPGRVGILPEITLLTIVTDN